MRKLLLLLLTVISVSVSAQYQPSGSKVRYVNGIGLGSKLDAAFGTADSLVLYARKSDSVLVFKYGNTAKALQYAVNATGILWGNGTTVNGSLYTFSNDSVITFRGTKFLQNVSTNHITVVTQPPNNNNTQHSVVVVIFVQCLNHPSVINNTNNPFSPFTQQAWETSVEIGIFMDIELIWTPGVLRLSRNLLLATYRIGECLQNFHP